MHFMVWLRTLKDKYHKPFREKIGFINGDNTICYRYFVPIDLKNVTILKTLVCNIISVSCSCNFVMKWMNVAENIHHQSRPKDNPIVEVKL